MILSLYCKIDLKVFNSKCVLVPTLLNMFTMHTIKDTCLDSFRLNHLHCDKSIELELTCLLQLQLLFSLNVCVLKLGENTLYGQKDVDTLF